jgi:hypothetical protein
MRRSTSRTPESFQCVSQPPQRRQLHQQLQDTADQGADGETGQALFRDAAIAKAGIDQPRQGDAANDAAEVEEGGGHGGDEEHFL